MRVGFIDASGITHRHLGVLTGFSGLEVAAIADLELQRAEAAVALKGARAYAAMETMLDAERLDLVWTSTRGFRKVGRAVGRRPARADRAWRSTPSFHQLRRPA